MSVANPVGELLVIFDCDGVLVDTEPISARVSAQILTGLGWSMTEADVIRTFMGCTEEFWRGEVQARTGRAVDATWEAEFGPAYEAAFDEHLTEIAGIRDVIAWLPWPYCVASNGSHAKVRANLQRVGLTELWNGAIFSAEDVAAGKPAPDLFLHAASTMGYEPKQCVVVEDSVHGVMAARAAGMRSFAYVSGLIDPSTLDGPGTILFQEMADLPVLLREAAGTGQGA